MTYFFSSRLFAPDRGRSRAELLAQQRAPASPGAPASAAATPQPQTPATAEVPVFVPQPRVTIALPPRLPRTPERPTAFNDAASVFSDAPSEALPPYTLMADDVVATVRPASVARRQPSVRLPQVAAGSFMRGLWNDNPRSHGHRAVPPSRRPVRLPTHQGETNASVQRWYILPGAKIAVDINPWQRQGNNALACADFPQLTGQHWADMVDALRPLRGWLLDSQWPAAVAYIAGLRQADHVQGIRDLETMLWLRKPCQPGLEPLLQALPQLPSQLRVRFASVVMAGLGAEGYRMPEYARLVQTLARLPGWAEHPAVGPRFHLQPHVARAVCGIALGLMHSGNVVVSQQQELVTILLDEVLRLHFDVAVDDMARLTATVQTWPDQVRRSKLRALLQSLPQGRYPRLSAAIAATLAGVAQTKLARIYAGPAARDNAEHDALRSSCLNDVRALLERRSLFSSLKVARALAEVTRFVEQEWTSGVAARVRDGLPRRQAALVALEQLGRSVVEVPKVISAMRLRAFRRTPEELPLVAVLALVFTTIEERASQQQQMLLKDSLVQALGRCLERVEPTAGEPLLTSANGIRQQLLGVLNGWGYDLLGEDETARVRGRDFAAFQCATLQRRWEDRDPSPKEAQQAYTKALSEGLAFFATPDEADPNARQSYQHWLGRCFDDMGWEIPLPGAQAQAPLQQGRSPSVTSLQQVGAPSSQRPRGPLLPTNV